MTLLTRLVSEFIGTAFLLMIVVGSGIMGESLAQGNVAVALLANSLATGAGLFVLIQSLGPISGAHFNPVVSFLEMLWGRLGKKEFALYVGFQILGALAGVLLAHLMFDLPLLQLATKERTGLSLTVSEFIATFGLIGTIALAGKKHVELAPMSIAAYITSAYWFTASTSFANPAVTLARMFTNTFCGIGPMGVPHFLLGQIAGAVAAYLVLRSFFSKVS